MKSKTRYLVLLFICLITSINAQNAQILKPSIADSTNAKEEPFFIIQEKAPEFIGGIKAMFGFLGANLRYPALSRKYTAEGTAYVGFVVNTDGSLQDIREIKFIKTPATSQKKQDKIPEEAYQELVKEAIRVVKLMPNWQSGEQSGRPANVAFTLPIKFKL
jgi:periplasmic protein TonB